MLNEVKDYLEGGSDRQVMVYASACEDVRNPERYRHLIDEVDDFIKEEVTRWEKDYLNPTWKPVFPNTPYYWDVGTWGDDFPYMALCKVEDLTTFTV
jgi:hypothetical protein